MRVNSSALIPFFIVSVLQDSKGTNEVLALNQVQTILISDALLGPILRAANITSRFKKWFLAPHAPTQEKMNYYYKGSSWHLGERYTDMIKTLFLSLFYMTLLPFGMFITAFAFLTQYAADKYLLLRQWRTHNQLAGEVARSSQIPICVCFLVHVTVAANFFAAWPFDEVCGKPSGLGRVSETYRKEVSHQCCADGAASKFPNFPLWPEVNSRYMSADQQYLVQIYRAGIVLCLVPMVVVFCSRWFVNTFFWLFTGAHKSVTKAEEHQELDRFSSDELGAGSLTAYVPQVDQKGLLYPLIACDTSGIDARFCRRWQYTGEGARGAYNIAFHSSLQQSNSLHASLEAYVDTSRSEEKKVCLSVCRQYSVDEAVSYSYFETRRHGAVALQDRSTTTFDELPEIKRAKDITDRQLARKGKPDPRSNEFTPDADRKCTDISFLLLLCLVWLGALVLISVGNKYGDPHRLLYGDNFQGNTCGTGTLVDKKLVYYPTLQQDLVRAYATGTYVAGKIDFFGVCVAKCPVEGDNVTWVADGKTYVKFSQFDSSNVLFRCLNFNRVETDYAVECLQPFTMRSPLPCQKSDVGIPALNRSVFLPATTASCKQDFVDLCRFVVGDDGRKGREMLHHESVACMKKWTTNETAELGLRGEDCTKARIVKMTTTDQPAKKTDPIFDELQGWASLLGRWVGDVLLVGGPILLCGVLFAMVFSVIWLVLIEHFVSHLIQRQSIISYVYT